MSEQNNDKPALKIVGSTPYLELVQQGRWAFVRRTKGVKVVAIVAVTDQDKLILVEQFRVPVAGTVIELPAGLAGDSGDPDEPLQSAAERELLEESGYVAKSWKQLAAVTSSAGMTNEQVTIFHARDLTHMSAGGGIDEENITVHEIPLCEIENWLRQRTAAGAKVDSRVYAAIHWASNEPA